MILSDFGKIVSREWYKSFKIRNELFLDEFIIMPNHLHAILILFDRNNKNNKTNGNVGDGNVGDGNAGDGNVGDGNVETHARVSLHTPNTPNTPNNPNNPIPQSQQYIPIRNPKSISSFIGSFKSRVITKIDDFIDDNELPIEKYNRQNPLWQANYNDHIIRNKNSYHKIKNYIIQNPENWKDDAFN